MLRLPLTARSGDTAPSRTYCVWLVATSDWSRAAGAYPCTQKPTKQEPLRLAMPASVADEKSPTRRRESRTAGVGLKR
jgi:hypothetical protein